jgi:predicted nucleic acid-binding protein
MDPNDVPPGPLLVDTDVFSMVHYARDPDGRFEGLLIGHPLALSFAGVGELRAGAIKARWGSRRLTDQARFLTAYTVIPANNDVVTNYAPLHAALHSNLRVEASTTCGRQHAPYRSAYPSSPTTSATIARSGQSNHPFS